MSFLTLLGWFGMVLYLLNHAYIALVSDWHKTLYYGGNAIAALALTAVSIGTHSSQAIATNAFWAVISVLLLLGISLKKLPVSMVAFKAVLGMFWVGIIFLAFSDWIFAISLLGWSSTFVFSIGYLLFSAEKMPPRYYMLNSAYAASAILPQLWLDKNWPVFWLELIWFVLSCYGAIKKFRQPHLID